VALHPREQDSHRCGNLKAIALGLDIPACGIVICHEVTLHLSLHAVIYPYGLKDTSKNAHNMTKIVLHFFFKAHCATSSNMIGLRYPL
jgi:hypothetical protein